MIRVSPDLDRSPDLVVDNPLETRVRGESPKANQKEIFLFLEKQETEARICGYAGGSPVGGHEGVYIISRKLQINIKLI
jgi:hypothetical protein